MTLATRLSLFFLAALALVLAGFSILLFGLARLHLAHRVDQRLQAGIAILSAAVEFEPQGLEWDPNERLLVTGSLAGEETLAWAVLDAQGQRVDASSPADFQRLQGALAESANPASSDLRVDRNWQWSRRVLHSDNATGPYPPGFHQTLVLLTGVSVQGDRHLLQFLALTLLGVSTVILLLAALGGRWLCQRALLPLAQMAQSARSISGADMSERLQIPSTKDELIALAQAFNDLLARLEDAFERQRRFTGEASHQLRTPLAAMLGQVEVALRRERTSAEYRVTLDTVHHEARRMVQIVEMLLFLARTDSAALDLHLEPTELAVWLTEHLQRWQGHPRGRDIEMLGETISLRTHPVMLGQAVDNLLDNACKYSQPGTAIKVRLEQDPNEVRLIVEDQGCGIDPEDLPYLFSPFFRSHAARRQGIVGVGLGLAVVSRIVQALGGQVRVTSVVGSGSRFVMRFGEVDAGCVKNRHDSVR